MNYRTRIIEGRLSQLAKSFKIVLLTGARQVGKSTLLTYLFPTVKSFVFDPIQDISNARAQPDLFLKNFGIPLILDEIQYVPELLPSLKRFVDVSQQKGQYLLTGSQQFSVMKNVSESLAGRVVIIPMQPMTPHELYDTFEVEKNWFIDYLNNPAHFFSKKRTLLANTPSALEATWRGGMPGIIGLTNDELPAYFSSYVQTYVERDVRLLEDISNLATFGRFLGLIAALSSQEINYSQLGREIDISPKSAQRWLNLLTYTYQWTELPAFHMNSIKRLSSRPKGFIADTGLACYLQRILSPEALAVSPLGGALFESYCFNMIKGLCSALPAMPNFYHWRTLAGAEVDIIIELNGQYYPIEVKSTAHATSRDARGIRAFKETYPHLPITTGIILYAGAECYQVAENVVAVPWNLQ